MEVKKLDENIKSAFSKLGFTEQEMQAGCWELKRSNSITWIALHKFLEVVAIKSGIIFDAPQIIEANTKEKISVICVNGRRGESQAWSIGEAAPYNNKNEYPFAMAEKRAKDRVILKLIGLHGYLYSEEEADDFKKLDQSLPNVDINGEIIDKEEATKSYNTALGVLGTLMTTSEITEFVEVIEKQESPLKKWSTYQIEAFKKKAREKFKQLT